MMPAKIEPLVLNDECQNRTQDGSPLTTTHQNNKLEHIVTSLRTPQHN